MYQKIKPYYQKEVQSISEKIKMYKDCFKFVLVADTHLDNSIEDTVSNIRATDNILSFECVVHLGDFLNGSIPENYTKKILNNQMDIFRNSIENKCFYPVQGNHDGYADISKNMTGDMAIDEDWYEATKFVDKFNNVIREIDKAYYAVDYPDEKIRLIVINSFHYSEFSEHKKFEKKFGIDDRQVLWLKNIALKVEKGWTVMFFSHDTPFSQFGENALTDNQRINGNKIIELINEAKKENGFEIAGWFVGHFHGDYIENVAGINFIVLASQTAYVPQLWSVNGDFNNYPARELNTASEDLWDAVVIDKQNKKVRLFRFGAGADREIDY